VLAYSIDIGADLVSRIAKDGFGAISSGAFASDTPEQVSARFTALLSDPTRVIILHAVFMIITVGIVARGLEGGIEKTVTILMPAFFVMLMVLFVFALIEGNIGQGVDFLLGVRADDLLVGVKNGSVINAARGQAFFSIGLG